MQFELEKILDALKDWKEDLIASTVLLGIVGAYTRLSFEKSKKYTLGQKFLIVVSGAIVAYLVGSIAKSLDIEPSWMSLLGFFCGMFGHSAMKYTIDNESALFYSLSTKIAALIDLVIHRIATWVPTKDGDKPKPDNDETE